MKLILLSLVELYDSKILLIIENPDIILFLKLSL